MSVPPAILLNLLSSGVRAVAGRAPAEAAAPGASDFSSMFSKARAGELSTGLPVTIARNTGLELSDDQLARLAPAADRAESAGARRALVLMDGRALEIDVATRQVTREHTLGDARVVTGIDSVIDLGGHTGTSLGLPVGTQGAGDVGASSRAAVGRLGQARWNRSMVDALAGR